MIRYIAVTDKDDWKIKNENILCIDKKPPDTPYIKIKIKILKKNKLFSLERNEPVKHVFKKIIGKIINQLEKLN